MTTILIFGVIAWLIAGLAVAWLVGGAARLGEGAGGRFRARAAR
jgi:type IV secretory pathway TrbD component